MTTPPLKNEHDIVADKSLTGGIRLNFLDGLRGLAALYVVAHHIYWSLGVQWHSDQISPLGRMLSLWLQFGHYGVAIFIVLSGYCLMLPLAKKNVNTIPNGIKDFFVRRSLRILPPYYGAIVLIVFLAILFPAIRERNDELWANAIPILTPRAIASHLLLIQNLSTRTVYTIDYPAWSVATEWQIYFVYVFALLPTVRKFGIVPMLGVGIVLGTILDKFFPWACFHYITLFAIGVAGAKINFSPKDSVENHIDEKTPWGWLTLVTFGAFCFFNRHGVEWFMRHASTADLLAGITTICFIIWSGSTILRERSSPSNRFFLRILESPPAIMLGAFSYSLYLIHAPVIAMVNRFFSGFPMPLQTRLCISIVAALPLCLVAGYVFYRLIEKPSMNYRVKLSDTVKR